MRKITKKDKIEVIFDEKESQKIINEESKDIKNYTIIGEYKYDYDIIALHKEILNRIKESDKNQYLEMTKKLITQYQKIKTNNKVYFGEKQEKDLYMKKRINIIETYISIANQYIPLYIVRINNTSQCKNCGNEIIGIKCENCGISKEIKNQIESNKKFKTKIERKKSFIKTFDYFSGEIIDITENDKKIIINYIDKNNMNKEKLNRKQIYNILHVNNMSKYYHSINYLYYFLTDKKIPYYKDKYDSIIKKFDLFDEEREIQNGLNMNDLYLIWYILQLEDFIIKSSELHILRTYEVKNRYNLQTLSIVESLKKKYPEMNWKYIPFE